MTLHEIALGANTLSVSLMGRYHLPKSKQRFVTAACLAYEDDLRYLVCADMVGSLHLYVSEERITETTSLATLPTCSLSKTHGKGGLTDIHFFSNYIHTVGRDGFYNKWSIIDSQLVNCSQFKISKQFDWIAKLIPEGDGNTKLVVFHNTELLLYDLLAEQVVLRLDCGGGHRSWAFSQAEGCHYFAYIKDKTTNLASKAATLPCTRLVGEHHSGKITDCRMFSMRGRDFLVTSADDGHVIVCEIVNAAFSHVSHEREAVLKTRCSTLVHISNTKCLTLTPSLAGNDDVIVFSGGGRAQLLVSVLTCDADGEVTGAVKSSMNVTKGVSMFRRQSRDDNSEEADVRIMAVTSHPLGHYTHLISAACSDGTIK
ncbi:WDR6 [Bugula neritina]|uniref:WDR6 n=1 Tax=Bugula neritina TaxID=10212 RepID=A0A7J7KG08_BUGNE|nr:WDR6 [Bugula neritina]